jgi:subtilisin family serine protease
LSSPQFSAAQNSPHVPGELLIAPKAGVSETDLENQYKARGGQKIKTISQIKVHHIKVPAQALEAIEGALRKNPKIEYVEKNFIAEANLVPNDPGYPSEWHLPQISAPSGWDITTGSSSVPIAVIDSGVDPYHPDLSGKLIAGYNFLAGNTDTHDGDGHGTAVAGTLAAASNSGIGIAGVAWQNPIMPIVVWDTTHAGTYANIAAAINYAARSRRKGYQYQS